MGYLYIFFTILCGVYGQVVLKWRITIYGKLPDPFVDKIVFLLKLFLDPYILSSFIAAFIGALCWMAAMTKFELSHAYPFIGLTFILVLFFSGLLFHEAITPLKIVGVTLVIIGIVVGSKG